MSIDVEANKIWIVGSYRRSPIQNLWKVFQKFSSCEKFSIRSPTHNQSNLSSADLIKSFQDFKHKSFEVSAENVTFSYIQNGSFEFDQLMIEGGKSIVSPKLANALVVEFLNERDAFIQCHVVDSRFELLQNMYDPLQFEAYGISLKGLPLKSNGLPPPLESTIVDTSKNPARYELKDGFIETSAAYMWFGEQFWSVIGKSPEDVANKLPEEVAFKSNGCWYLEVSSGVFTDESTAKIQNSIRSALFR